MPEKETIERAREDAQEGKAPTTQAGEFVREEIDHVLVGTFGHQRTERAVTADELIDPGATRKCPSPP